MIKMLFTQRIKNCSIKNSSLKRVYGVTDRTKKLIFFFIVFVVSVVEIIVWGNNEGFIQYHYCYCNS